MTLIAALVDQANDRVVMVGDRRATGGYDRYQLAAPKLWRGGPFLVGGCGSGRLLQVLEFGVPWGTLGADLPRRSDGRPDLTRLAMASVVLPAIRKACEEGGALLKHEDTTEELPGEVLVAVGPTVYLVMGDLDALPEARPYVATGSGACLALGSLHTTAQLRFYNGRPVGPEERLLLAAQAASAHNVGVGEPYDFRDTITSHALAPHISRATEDSHEEDRAYLYFLDDR
jgi:hypothetical protein